MNDDDLNDDSLGKLTKTELTSLLKESRQKRVELERLLEMDVVQMEETRRKLADEHEYLKAVVNNVSDSIMVIDKDYAVKLMNDATRSTLKDLNIFDINNPKCYEVSHHRSTPCDSEEHPCPLKKVLETSQPATVLHNHSDPDGSSHFFELTATPIFDQNSVCVGIVESAHDITEHITLNDELKEKGELLQYQAHHDGLTGLPNRALFSDRLEQAIISCSRNHHKLALLFIDLDHFKSVNDTHGHHAGDEVLREAAKRINSTIRQIDTFARLGGDEFTIIMKDIKRKEDASTLASKIIAKIIEPFELGNGLFVSISCSVGVSVHKKSDSAEDLLKHADSAMYKAKELGKNNFQHYEEAL